MQLLRSPAFHCGVRCIHRTIEEFKHGRDPNEPLRQGEATADPNRSSDGFFKHFVDELRNQIRGTPTDPPPPPKNAISKNAPQKR
ncbi:uncharacterized protein BCR38DRAFT_334734 [Pseudomassariella vexata]|uniref:Uncharacterized protein n=1 Tax=Pseudomassariella vexata TaxID=1141098 RepID=A0A1Y2EAJ6_9PEZI|nr:uncharacterized protein BCR38DRAFT_334734 [Pseudomassariella vexata]ORY68334.1 hypothetical protein BCR38DRAFT_334734 [Pseudomassariella vexata]